MSRCAILGASGHGKVVAELAMLNGYTDIHFYDDSSSKVESLECWAVYGDSTCLLNRLLEYQLIVIAIGDNDIRLEKQHVLKNAGGIFKPLIHPAAVISESSTIGCGTVVMANAVVNPFSFIGEACIINTSSSVDHDCYLSNGVHVSPGVHIAGSVKVSEGAWIGIGSQIKQSISVGRKAIVGAGATVITDVADNSVVVGTPAKPITLK